MDTGKTILNSEWIKPELVVSLLSQVQVQVSSLLGVTLDQANYGCKCTALVSLHSVSYMVSSNVAHLPVCSGLETTFADNHSEGEEAEVVAGAGS